MNQKRDSSEGGRHQPSSAAAKERLAAALRENLQRRKAQARGQQEQRREPVEPDVEPDEAPG